MAKPYLMKLGEVAGVRAHLVDGEWIRNCLDVDFTNGAHHFSRSYIPVNEVWVDREAPRAREINFLVRHQYYERDLMKAGVPYLRALRMANHVERRERRRSLPHHVIAGSPELKREYVLKRQIGEVDGDAIWLVNGSAVRGLYDINFTQGGHHLRYRWTPSRHIWIDDALLESEREFVVAHEVHELHLMRQGMRYYPAHDSALELEQMLRTRGLRRRAA